MKKNILSLGAFLASSAIFLSPCTAFAAEGSPDILTTESTIEATADETGNDVVTFSVDDQTIVSDEVENSADYIGNNAYTDGLFGTKYEVTGDKVNVRTGPGTSYESVAQLYKGDVVTVKSIENGWAKFKYHKEWRYISTSYLRSL